MVTRSPSPRQRPPRAWQRMLSGRRLDLLDPSPLDVEIEDIAHGLARVARWNGQTTGPHVFSVAQHCLLVEEIAVRLQPGLETCWRLAVLLHDAPEYVIGDMISPFKAVIGGDYKTVEARLMGAIHIRFGLPATAPAAIAALTKRADHVAAFLEATQLAGFGHDEATAIFGAPNGVFGGAKGVPPVLVPMDSDSAKAAYLARFAALAA
ncbi:HD family hydrolase [Phreatobacter sp.]|uniref:HD family hydrolase n=1 Tax=Phreatobacter sp. TaxID=1966341 RepID=UPI0025F28C79|nr:HD family hydrolase [Phreatobacter sp.]